MRQRGWSIDTTLRAWLAPAICIAAFFSPPLLVSVISGSFFANSVLPEIILDPVKPDLAVGIFLELTKVLITMSVGSALSSIWLYRQPLKPSRQRWSVAIVVTALALVSLYSGLRFLFDMAQQLRFVTLEFEPLSTRLYIQGWCLVFQTSMLSLGGAFYLFYRDARHRGGT